MTPDDYGYALDSNDTLRELIAEPKIRFVVNGHSHRVMVRHFPELTIVNAGTLKADNDPGCLLIDFDAKEVTVYELTGTGFELRRTHELW